MRVQWTGTPTGAHTNLAILAQFALFALLKMYRLEMLVFSVLHAQAAGRQ